MLAPMAPRIVHPPVNAPPERRVDARRNYEQLIEGAVRVLAVNPSASLQDIATEAGLHRATLHRHFRSREDLMEVLRRRAAERTLANLDAVAAEGLAPADALASFVRRALEGAMPDGLWRFSTYYGAGADEHRDEIRAKLAALMAAAQAVGATRADLSPLVLGSVWSGVTYGMLPLVHDGELAVGEAARVVLATLRGA